MITPAAFLALLLALGYVASREHVKRRDAEATADDWIASHSALEARHADAEAKAHTWQTLQAAEAELKRKAMEDRDWERMLRMLAEDEIERHRDTHACLPTLDGIAAHGVAQPVGEVVDDEPTWVGLVREVADVVPLKKRGAK